MREPDSHTHHDGSASTDPSPRRRDTERAHEVRETTATSAAHALARRRWLIPTDPPPV